VVWAFSDGNLNNSLCVLLIYLTPWGKVQAGKSALFPAAASRRRSRYSPLVFQPELLHLHRHGTGAPTLAFFFVSTSNTSHTGIKVCCLEFRQTGVQGQSSQADC
jgi:hypothetical protein